MIKYCKILLSAVILLVAVTSCQKDFLEQSPTTEVSANSATSSTENLALIINGIHRLMYERQDNNGEGGYQTLMIQHDMLGEDLVMNARANGWFVSTASWNDHTNAVSGNLRFGWELMYEAINNANIVIAGAENAVGIAADRNSALGEAYAFRAFGHFILVQRHAARYREGGNNTQLGIPVVLQSTTDGLPRSSVEEVYAQINADLDQAITLMEGYTRSNNSHFNQRVAQGLKARVNLVQGNWAVAADFAEQARDGFSLMSNDAYLSGFNDYSNEEWMWGAFYNEEQGSAFTNFDAYMSRNFSSSNIRGNPKSIFSVLYDQIPETDIRSKVFSKSGEHENLPAGYEISSRHSRFPYTSQKFLSFSEGDSRGDIPYMRAAEMYLIEAEAKARLGSGGAEALLPLAQNRNPDYELSTNTGEALIQEILLQRRWELWGEGFRFLDLKRLNLPLDRTGGNHDAVLLNGLIEVPADDPRWLWLIPQQELDANPNMEQN